MTQDRIRPTAAEPDSVSPLQVQRTRLRSGSVRRRPIALWRIAVALTLLCFLGFGCGKKTASEESEHEGPTTAVPVRAVVVRRTTLHPSIDLVGTFQAIPELTAIVSPQAGGWIVDKVNVVEGQKIKADDTLVILDARKANNAFARAQAVVNVRRAVLTRLKIGYRKEEIEAARQNAKNAKQTVAGLQLRFDALEPLLNRNEVSPVVYNKAKSDLKAAQATQAAAEANLSLKIAGPRPELITEAHAQLDTAIADRKAADLAVKFCKISSPIDGTV
ncbi:MAG: biotin/lipoyl-binding protein, partial [Planctomycetes bacterium]|nr:biotin/lipoyl-binding protein [Planctomycetota bacterium]